jgi:hypothetical protein
MLLVIGANLVGFVLGVDGAQYFAHELVGRWDGKSCSESPCAQFADWNVDLGIRFLLVACSCLFVGVQLMFEYGHVGLFMNAD